MALIGWLVDRSLKVVLLTLVIAVASSFLTASYSVAATYRIRPSATKEAQAILTTLEKS